MIAFAYSCVLDLPPRSPVKVCVGRKLVQLPPNAVSRGGKQREWIYNRKTEDMTKTHLPIRQRFENRILDLIRMLIEFHMLQHHHTTQQQRRRIRQALARDIRRGAMHGFEDGALIADVPRRSEP